MANFPATGSTSKSNAETATKPVVITPPAFIPNDTRTAEERWIDQQWRDAAAKGVGAQHPLSINRDSSNVTTDPYA